MRSVDLVVLGTSRVADNSRCLMVSFNREPSDEELRSIDDLLKCEAPDVIEMKFGEETREVLFAGRRRAVIVR